MYIVRLHLTAQAGQLDAAVGVLRKWVIDVGDRIGFKPDTLRVITGCVGTGTSEIEIEAKFDALSDLESAWADMEKVPYHQQYVRDFGPLLVSGSVRWTIHRAVDLTPED
jgi:hypothetical protein